MNVTVNGAKVSDLINDKLAAIGEKIGVTKFERVDAALCSFLYSWCIPYGCIGWFK